MLRLDRIRVSSPKASLALASALASHSPILHFEFHCEATQMSDQTVRTLLDNLEANLALRSVSITGLSLLDIWPIMKRNARIHIEWIHVQFLLHHSLYF